MMIYAALLLFVVVQGMFGVGLLVFGTPFLLAMGHELIAIMGLLLPSSLVISLLQLSGSNPLSYRRVSSVPFSVAGVVLGTLLLTQLSKTEFLMPFAAVLMILATVVTLDNKFKVRLAVWVEPFDRLFHTGLGIIHGLSNLGGVLLTAYSAVLSSNKKEVRYCAAYFYFIFAGSQIFTISLAGLGDVFFSGLYFLPFALVTYVVIGRTSFMIVSERSFRLLSAVFFTSMSVVLLARWIFPELFSSGSGWNDQ